MFNFTQGETTSITLQLVRDRGTYGEVDIFVFPQNKQAFINEDFYCKQEVGFYCNKILESNKRSTNP